MTKFFFIISLSFFTTINFSCENASQTTPLKEPNEITLDTVLACEICLLNNVSSNYNFLLARKLAQNKHNNLNQFKDSMRHLIDSVDRIFILKINQFNKSLKSDSIMFVYNKAIEICKSCNDSSSSVYYSHSKFIMY